MSTVAAANTLTIKRLLKVPPEQVYAAWTKPEELTKWFGPETCRATAAQLDVRVGGAYSIHIVSQMMGEVEVRGVYREVQPPTRLVFTWQWSGHPQLAIGESLVTVEFLRVDGGTDVQITHERLPDAEQRDNHTDGWSGSLDKLAKVLGVGGECSGQVPAPGSFCWNELLTSDVAAARAFYTGLFGWEAVDFPMPDKIYTVFKGAAKDVGGMMLRPMPQTPPQWLAYVFVTDVDATAQKTTALGGTIIVPPMDVPTVGRIAVIVDPQGATVGLFKPAPK